MRSLRSDDPGRLFFVAQLDTVGSWRVTECDRTRIDLGFCLVGYVSTCKSVISVNLTELRPMRLLLGRVWDSSNPSE